MTTEQKAVSGGGLFSKLVLVLLLAATVGLYLRIVAFDDPSAEKSRVASQASVQVIEGNSAGAPVTAVALQDLPEDQMQLIIQVFAPELRQN